MHHCVHPLQYVAGKHADGLEAPSVLELPLSAQVNAGMTKKAKGGA